MARSGGKRILESERAERRIAASAAAGDYQPFAVHEPLLCQVNCSVGAVVDVDDTPRAFQMSTVFPSVARAPTIVYVEHGDAAAGPVLDAWIEGRSRHRRRTPMALHEKRGKFAVRRRVVPVLRRVEKSVRRPAVLGGVLYGDRKSVV